MGFVTTDLFITNQITLGRHNGHYFVSTAIMASYLSYLILIFILGTVINLASISQAR